ncbi:MAG: hypothetical protein AAF961_18155 [Planctomycetota bacterium]
MNAQMEDNENWSVCPKCGAPVMINPATGALEPCAECASAASKDVGAMGIGAIAAGLALIVALVYFCLRIL